MYIKLFFYWKFIELYDIILKFYWFVIFCVNGGVGFNICYIN